MKRIILIVIIAALFAKPIYDMLEESGIDPTDYLFFANNTTTSH